MAARLPNLQAVLTGWLLLSRHRPRSSPRVALETVSDPGAPRLQGHLLDISSYRGGLINGSRSIAARRSGEIEDAGQAAAPIQLGRDL
jgi:hypothetical protein